jgi:hypothetical protein
MGGKDSDLFEYFESLLFKGLMALNKRLDEITAMMKVMSYKSSLPCFKDYNYARFIDRFKPIFHGADDSYEKVS